jgi:hypothetical protein
MIETSDYHLSRVSTAMHVCRSHPLLHLRSLPSFSIPTSSTLAFPKPRSRQLRRLSSEQLTEASWALNMVWTTRVEHLQQTTLVEDMYAFFRLD